MGVKIVNPSISGSGGGSGSDPTALKKDANLSDLSNATAALTNLGIGTLPSRVSSLETKYVRSTRFEIISSGTSGTVTLPTGATVVLDDFGGTVDAIAAQVTSGRPIFENVRDAGGTIITTTFDSSGNYVLSGSPSSYPISIVYRIRQTLLNFNGTDSNIIGEYNIENGVDLHASTHLPSGSDPLTTAAPTTNLSGSTTNSIGSANSFARSDHTHTIDNATTLVAGFISAADKTKLDAITGTNTGDQTNITGNAGTATALQTARTINGVSFDGTTNITITAAAGTLTGTTLNASVVSSSLTSVGTISSGTWNGSTIDIAHGGTGQTTQNAALNALLPSQTGNSGKFLTSNGTDASWATIGGGGTVTSVSVVTANGVSGSVATATTTPAITLTLGAITPTSVAATGTVTGSNLSGTNTGDQTTITGNAGTATALQTARTINGVSFDGTANITITAAAGTLSGTTLNATVVNSSLTSVGTLTNLTVTNPITGSVTGSSGSTTGNAATATALQTARTINGVSFNGTANITVTADAGTLTGTTLNSTVVSSSLTSVGTITSGTWTGTTIAIANGGTGQTTANTALNALLPSQTGNNGKVLSTNGTNTSWVTAGTGTVTSVDVSGGTTGLTTSGGPITVSGTITLAGTLVAANGGTGQSSYTIGDILYASTTSALSKLAAVAAGSYLRSVGTGTAPVWSTTTLPNSATTGDLIYASASNTYSNLAGVATGNALISGGVGTAPSWGKVELTTHVSGTLPIANGGTALATTPTNGQLLIGNGTNYTLAAITQGYGTTITNGVGSITAAVSLTSSETSSTTTNTTSSTTYTLLTNSISGTPAAGTWLIMFSCSMGLNTTSAAQTFITLYTGPSGSTTQVSGTERRVQNGSGGQGGSVVHSASFQTVQTFNGTNIYEIRWRVSAGTSSIFSRVISLLRIA